MGEMYLKDGVYWVGVKDPNLKVFDIIMTTKRGSTYNSYLLVDEKVAVIDTVKSGFFDEYYKNLTDVLKGRKVDYIIVNHTEPDHSGSLRELLDKYPEAEVFGSKAACNFLKKIVNRDFKAHPVADGEVLNLGDRSLKFISAPFLHWPDTIFTYVPQDKMLFSCDVFGSHYCSEHMFSDEAGDFTDEVKYYFDVIMGPFKKYVISAMEKIDALDIDMICPSHGPIIRNNIRSYINMYRKWSSDVLKQRNDKLISIFYISAYGNTKLAAQLIKEEAERKGFDVKIFDISKQDLTTQIEAVNESAAVFIGSPTINQDAVKPAWDLLSLISPIINRGKAAGAFGSYGWSGEGPAMITERLKGLKFKTIEPVRVNFVPSEDEKKKVVEFADKLLAMI